MKLFAVKTRLRLQKIDSSQKPQEIITAYDHLKGLKEFTNEFEKTAKNLYSAQEEILKFDTLLCNQIINFHIANKENKFQPFLKMSRKYKVLNEQNKKHLENMKKHLILPLMDFNHFGAVNKCKKLKVKLKRKKGEYDMLSDELQKTKMKRVYNVPSVNKLEIKSEGKLQRLNALREEFLERIEEMETEKISLMKHIKEYANSYGEYAQMVVSGLR